MMLIKGLTCIFALIAGLFGVPGDEEPELFGPTAEDASLLGTPEPWELRSRLAAVNTTALSPWCSPAEGSVPDTLTVNLFPDAILTGTADRIGRSGRATLNWRGTVKDVPGSSITLSAIGLCDDDTRFSLAGSARINGEEFTIEPRTGDRVVITEIDTTTAGLLQHAEKAPDHLPVPLPPVKPKPKPKPVQPAKKKPRLREVARSGDSIIDVLMLVTPGAAKAAGGKEEIEAWIEDAATRANDALADSGVKASFRVVGYEHVAYAGKETVQPGFDALSRPKDGKLDDATALRERHGADVVTAVVGGYDPNDGIAGLASYPENPMAKATSGEIWSVVAANQLWAYVLPHEWGHLLGLDHDWTTSPESNTYYPDNHGYVPGSEKFVTIMGYPSACSPRPCPYIGYFANPAITAEGEALGVKIGHGRYPADNARVMNLTAPQVASYREPRDPLPALRLNLLSTAGGTVQRGAPNPFGYGDVASVTAAADPGYVFDGWTLDGAPAGSANPTSVTMWSDRTLAARFIKGTGARHRLSVSTAPGTAGSVRLSPAGGDYTEGTAVTATARNTTGYQFAGWLLDGRQAGDDPVLHLQMSRPHSLVARYAGERRALDVSNKPGWGGRVDLSEPSPSGDLVAHAHPAAGFRFVHWLLDGQVMGTQPALSMTILGEDTLQATFAAITSAGQPVRKPTPKAQPKKKPTVKKAKKKPVKKAKAKKKAKGKKAKKKARR